MVVRNNDEKLTRAEFEKVLKVILIILKKWNILIHKLIFRAWWTIPWSAACWRCFKLHTPGSSHPSCANTCWCRGPFPVTIKFSQKSTSHSTEMKKGQWANQSKCSLKCFISESLCFFVLFWYWILNRAGRQLQKPSCMLFQVKTIDALLATF